MRGSNSVIEYKLWSCNVLITDWFWRDINKPPLHLSWSTFVQCANTIANKDFKWILVGTQAVHECNLDCLRQQNGISDICPISAGCVIWYILPLGEKATGMAVSVIFATVRWREKKAVGQLKGSSRSYNILHPLCSLPLERLHRGPFGRDGLPFSLHSLWKLQRNADLHGKTVLHAKLQHSGEV